MNATSQAEVNLRLRRVDKSARFAIAAFVLAASSVLGQAQPSLFSFDPTGNLLTEYTESSTPPQILTQPQQQIAGPGELASFFVVAADTSGLTYQWRFYGTNVGGANADTLLVTNVSPSNEGPYSVVLFNNSGSVTSAPAMLWYDGNGNGLPDSWELAYFGNLTQNPTGDYDGDGVSNLQEFLDGTNPTNSASALFRLSVDSDGGTVDLAPFQSSYTNGQIVTLTALPANTFNAWTGPFTSRSNVLTLTLTSNITVFAHFSPLNCVWVSPASGDWTTATNWNFGVVPGSNDIAIINSAVTVSVNSNSDCGGLILGSANISPILSGTATLTIHGDAAWLGGTMSGGGTTALAPGATLTLNNPNSLSLSSRTLDNAGTVQWTGGAIGLNSSVITNRPGALFQTPNAASLFNLGGSDRFDNAGTLLISSADNATTTFGQFVALNNYGAINVQGGTLLCTDVLVNNGTVNLAPGTTNRLVNGGSATGTFNTPATALVEWTGGSSHGGVSYTLSNGVALNGAGLYRINSTYCTLSCSVDTPVTNLDLVDGTLSGAGTVTIYNIMNWAAGTMSGGGRTFFPPGTTLNLNNPNSVNLNSRTLDNGGTVQWTGPGAIGLSSSVITNRPGALFQTPNAASVFGAGGVIRFDNAGTLLISSANNAVTTFGQSVPLNNYGTINVAAGTLLCNDILLNNGTVNLGPGTTNLLVNGGSAAGTFNTPATALVEWSGGSSHGGVSYTLNNGVALNGACLYRINSTYCTLNCFADTGVTNLDILAGILSGTGSVTVYNVMNWTAGTMNGGGRTFFPAGSTLNLNNPVSVSLSSRTLDNGGTVQWAGVGGIGLGSSVITNRPGALFQAQADSSFSNLGGVTRLDNAGIFRKLASTGTTTIGNFVPLNNFGTVDIRSGIIAASGGYGPATNSTLSVGLGGTIAGTGYGQLQASGAVTLNGSLSVDFENGFLPAVGNSFTVLTAGTRTGAFGAFTYPSNQLTLQLSNSPTAVILSVTGIAAPPPPMILSPTISGSNVLLTWTAVANTTYRVEYTTSLSSIGWSALAGDVIATNNTASKPDVLVSTNRFYRVQVIP
jgi:hypothetical protein